MHEPLTIGQIEALSGRMFQVAQETFPDLSHADLAALLGYAGAKMLNTAHDLPAFRIFGGLCYDILTYKEESP